MTEREGQLYFVISEWLDQVFDSKDESISTLVEYIMELEDKNDDW